ncbi:MAG: FHA domain-containing protein [Gemmataceae bacterium]|nr:FHA domain-containing protein [Gemmataceae bacterium]
MKPIARLVLRTGGEGLLFLRPGRYVIGRGSDCDLILPSERASRRHAALEVADGTATLVDLDSRNGTLVDGEPTERSMLRHGSVIEIGDSVCVFEWLAAAAFGDDIPTPSVPSIASSESPALTPAERRVLTCLLGGLAEKAIASKLAISQHTVHSHVKRIYAAYGINSRSELLAKFIARPSEWE